MDPIPEGKEPAPAEQKKAVAIASKPEADSDAEQPQSGGEEKTTDEFQAARRPEAYEQYEMTNKYDYAPFELSEFAESFKFWDILGDGQLSASEAKRAMESVGEGQSDEDYQEALNKVDPKGEGLLNFQKFVDLLYCFRRAPVTEYELQETFDLMDMDKSGTISAGELTHLLMCVGNALSAGDAEAMIAEADTDCSGEVEYDEFAHMILSTQ